jgi:DNA polymerase (family 10)
MLVVVLKAWGIEMRRAAQGRRHMHRAAEPLKVAEKHLRKARPDIVRISPAGDFRRGCELVGHLSLVAEVRDPPDSTQALSMGVELTARLTDAAHFGVTLLLATGSVAHLAGLRAIAASQSMSLDDDGLRRDGKLVAAASEDSIYRALGMQPVPPELREGRNEIAQGLPETYPSLSPITISPGSSTRIPIAPTVSIRLRRWPRPR